MGLGEQNTKIENDIWTVDGPVVSFYGFPYPTRMAVVRLDEGLWIWSPVELTDDLMAKVSELGRVRWIVSPNKLHHLFISQWLEAFEDAEAWAPPGLPDKRPGIEWAGTLGDTAPAAWAEAIDQVVFGGSLGMEEVLFFHRPSSTCLVGDLIQRQPPEDYHWWQRIVMRLDGMTGPGGSTPRELRAGFVRRAPARRALERALRWAPRRLVIAHGRCALENGAGVLGDNLAWVRRPWPM